MQKYDVTLKLLLQGSAGLTMLELAGGPVEKWLNVELPKIQNLLLAKLGDHKAAVRKIVGRISDLPPAERETAFQHLLMLAGLRRLEETVRAEIQKMPVFIDILENTVIGPAFKKGLEEGELKGQLKGELKGQLEGELKGELKILRRQIEKRFGPIPQWADERLTARSATELEDLSVRLLDAGSIEELL